MYEEQLSEGIISFLIGKGYKPIVQVQHPTGSIDFVGVNSSECIVIESKISKWKSALRQAIRYGYGAEKAYVALPPPTAEYVANNFRDAFEKYGVGLMQVAESDVAILINCKSNIASPVFKRIILNEAEGRLLKSESRIQQFVGRFII